MIEDDCDMEKRRNLFRVRSVQTMDLRQWSYREAELCKLSNPPCLGFEEGYFLLPATGKYQVEVFH